MMIDVAMGWHHLHIAMQTTAPKRKKSNSGKILTEPLRAHKSLGLVNHLSQSAVCACEGGTDVGKRMRMRA